MAAQLLSGRVALVTGVSRRIGIAHAVVETLLADGASVHATGWSEHDRSMPWGADAIGDDALASGLDPGDGRFLFESVDLVDPAAPAALVDRCISNFGAIDVIVATHARSATGGLADTDVHELDACWAVNVRSVLLLAQRYLGRRDHRRPGGRIVTFTSGQHRGPMAGEIAYAVSKGAIHQMTATLADAFADLGVTVNCVNPGPTDTGWPEAEALVTRMMPAGRWGRPEDAARLVRFLVSDDAAWITGQVIDSEGGFRRWR